MEGLEKRLSANKTYVNAEMILKENHSLRLRQIEDEDLYKAVTNICSSWQVAGGFRELFPSDIRTAVPP